MNQLSYAKEAITVQAVLDDQRSVEALSRGAAVGCSQPENEQVVFVPTFTDLGTVIEHWYPRRHALQPALGMSTISKNPGPTLGVEESDQRTEDVLRIFSDRLFALFEAYKTQLQEDTHNSICLYLEAVFDPVEWEDGDSFPNPESFNSMLQFLIRHQEFAVPRIALSRVGYFSASWRAAPDILFSLEFRSDEMVRWLIFAPPTKKGRQKERGSGDSAVTTVLGRLENWFTSTSWMKRA